MRTLLTTIMFFFFGTLPILCFAQQDSSIQKLEAIPLKYLSSVNNKVEKYSDRISSKTENTLTKLAKWENKIHSLLQKADPAADAKLFGPGKLTFSLMLQKLKQGEALEQKYKAKYDSYRDKLTVDIKYISSKTDSLNSKFLQPLKKAKGQIEELDENISQSEAAMQLIKERKKELIANAMHLLGKNKYLAKIDKESWYYIETLKNYKEIFSDPSKAEETVKNILNKIPAFSKFMQRNSMLASLFGNSSRGGSSIAAQPIPGLQTRADVNALIQNHIAQGGPNAQAAFAQNLQQAQVQLNTLKDKILKTGGGSSDANIPDFKPNNQKTKLFKQRLQMGSTFQVSKPSSVQPATIDMGVSLGYKLNDKSIAGIGMSYKMGYGSIQRLSISSQGIGLRSFIDWKLKKQFFVSGGYELNYNTAFKNIHALQHFEDWQTSSLIGITKKLKMKTKFFKETKLQLLYDMFFREHSPVTQPVLFRIGYNF